MNQSEIEDSDHSSDEDYSPGSLVIDTAGFGGGVWMCVCACACACVCGVCVDVCGCVCA